MAHLAVFGRAGWRNNYMLSVPHLTKTHSALVFQQLCAVKTDEQKTEQTCWIMMNTGLMSHR